MRDLEAAWVSAMRRGDYEAAWLVSDKVLGAREPTTRDDPSLPYHLRWVWDGSDFRDRHVLVRCYHGLGDTLQFARYLPALRRVAASLSLEVQPPLVPLLATMQAADRLIPFQPAAPAPPSECDIEIMELPHALRLAPDFAALPYLCVDANPDAAGLTGLCWQAGGWDAERSVPPDLMAPLTNWPCVSLQPWPTRLPVCNPSGCPADIVSTAALIAGLDLVITVDTMVAHLAGALGRPTWLLLKHAPDWRWTDQGNTTQWYPSMRLYRQPVVGNWIPIVDQLSGDLRCRHGNLKNG